MDSIFKQEFLMHRMVILEKFYLKICITEFLYQLFLMLRSLYKEIFHNETESLSIVPAVCFSLNLHYLN